MANLIQDIEAQIAGAKATAVKQNIGVIREIGDGVAKVEGLGDAMLNEMLDLGNGITGPAPRTPQPDGGAGARGRGPRRRGEGVWRQRPGRVHEPRGGR